MVGSRVLPPKRDCFGVSSPPFSAASDIFIAVDDVDDVDDVVETVVVVGMVRKATRT